MKHEGKTGEQGQIHINTVEMNNLALQYHRYCFFSYGSTGSFTASSVTIGLHPQCPGRTPFDDDCAICRRESGLPETLIHPYPSFDQDQRMRSEGVQPHVISTTEAPEFVAEFNIPVARIFGRITPYLTSLK